MALEEMSVVVKADIAGYERELRRAEKIAERFRNQLAGRILGGGTAIAGGAAFIRGISDRMEALAKGEKSPLDQWFGGTTMREAREGLEMLEKKSATLKGLWTGIKDLFAAGVGEIANQVRFFGIDTATAENIRAGERLKKFDQGAGVLSGQKEMDLRYKALDDIQGITKSLNTEIDKTNMTEGDILRKKIEQLALGKEGTEVEHEKAAALEKVAEWEKRIADHKRDQARSAEALKDEALLREHDRSSLSEDIARQAASRNLRIERQRANDEEERQRMFDRSGFGDPENPIARYEAMISDLENRIAQETSGRSRLPGLATRDSQQAAQIINAAKNQEDKRHQEVISVLRQDLQTAREMLQVMRQALSGAHDLN